MVGTLKRRPSLSSGLSTLALTPLNPPSSSPSLDPVEEPQKERPYSFLALVLEGFADEPIPSWEERREPCPRMNELIDEKARPSIHRRKSLALIAREHAVDPLRRGSPSRRRTHYQMRQGSSDLDSVNEVVELSAFDADDSELINPANESTITSSLLCRYSGRSASERNLSRILTKGLRPNSAFSRSRSPLPSRDHIPAPLAPSPLSQADEAISLESHSIPSSTATTPTDHVSIPLTLPCLVPLPLSPPLRPLSIGSSRLSSSSEPPSLSSSFCSFTSSAPSSMPPTPLTPNFPLPSLLLDGTHQLKTVSEQETSE